MDLPEPWYPIRTPRLLLRDFTPEDEADIHEYGADEETTRFMPWGPNTPEATRAHLEKTLTLQRQIVRLDFGLAIALPASGKVIGNVALHLRDGPNRTAELGYVLNRTYWRQGYMSEAARALVDAGFRHLGLHRIFATCNAENQGSYGVMEKLGMRREGVLRRDRKVKGLWRDTYLYAVLAEEWRAAHA